jgi:hypothetical protein
MNFWLSSGWIIVRDRTILNRVPQVQSTAARVISSAPTTAHQARVR